MKLTFLNFVNFTDHKFNAEAPLEAMFAQFHPYSVSETSLISETSHMINKYLKIVASKSAALVLTPYSPTPEGLTIFVDGQPFWKVTDNGIYILRERTIIEIIEYDKEADTLIHHTIVITSITT